MSLGAAPPSIADAESTAASADHRTPDERHRAMTPDQVRGRLWAQRFKLVFHNDATTCIHCGGAVGIVACMEAPHTFRAILNHFEQHGALERAHYRPAPRAPPGTDA